MWIKLWVVQPAKIVIFVLVLGWEAASAAEKHRRLKGFCFPANTSLEQVRAYLGPLLLPRDQLKEKTSPPCLELKLGPRREELFRKYLEQKYELIRTYGGFTASTAPRKPRGEENMVAEHCRLEHIQRKKRRDQITTVKVGDEADARRDEVNDQRVIKSQLLVGVGMKGGLKVGSRDLDFVCHKAGAGRYRIDFSFEGFASSLKTSVTVSSGKKIDLGEVVDDLNKEAKRISLEKGIEWQQREGQESTVHELMVR